MTISKSEHCAVVTETQFCLRSVLSDRFSLTDCQTGGVVEFKRGPEVEMFVQGGEKSKKEEDNVELVRKREGLE